MLPPRPNLLGFYVTPFDPPREFFNLYPPDVPKEFPLGFNVNAHVKITTHITFNARVDPNKLVYGNRWKRHILYKKIYDDMTISNLLNICFWLLNII